MVTRSILLLLLSLPILTQVCPANCFSCTNSGVCTDCDTGYYLNNGSCSPNSSLSAGAIVGIVIGATLGVILLPFIIICLIELCEDNQNQVVPIDMNIPIEVDPYYLPVQNTATPFISQQLAHGYLNNNFTTTNQFLVSPVANNATPIPHLERMAPINPTATYVGRDTCSICFSGGTNIRLTPCTHQFHADCIVEWCNRRRICPNCNATNFQAMILCQRCFRFNEQVTFCPVGCQKPNHMDCFMQRNQNRLICRSCTTGVNVQNSIPQYQLGTQQTLIPQYLHHSQPNYLQGAQGYQTVYYR